MGSVFPRKGLGEGLGSFISPETPGVPTPQALHMFAPSPGAGVPSNQVPKLSKDVAADLHHVLVTGWGLERLGGRDTVSNDTLHTQVCQAGR